MTIARHKGVVLAVVVLVLVVQAAAPWAAAHAKREPVVVRLEAGAHAARQAGISAISEIDYGAFAWLEVDPDEIARLTGRACRPIRVQGCSRPCSQPIQRVWMHSVPGTAHGRFARPGDLW